jgi:hypothetical protein
MRKGWIVQVAAVLIPLLAGGALVYGRALRSARQAGDGLVPQPSAWVPFAADIQIVSDMGQKLVGRVYRARDGSSRTDTGLSMDKMTVSGIKNIPQAKFYLLSRDGWTVQPMELPPTGWVPTSFPARLVTRLAERVENFEVVRGETEREVSLFAPALNLYPIAQTFKKCAPGVVDCGTRLTNIVMGDQPADLFLPPGDATLVQLTKPGGIVKDERAERSRGNQPAH